MSLSRFFEARVDAAHRRDVFSGDAEVEQVDFVLAVCDSVNGDVIAVGFVGLCRCPFILRRCRRRRHRVLRSGSGGSSLLRRLHVVYRTVRGKHRPAAKMPVRGPTPCAASSFGLWAIIWLWSQFLQNAEAAKVGTGIDPGTSTFARNRVNQLKQSVFSVHIISCNIEIRLLFGALISLYR